jgi:hypothetical protein
MSRLLFPGAPKSTPNAADSLLLLNFLRVTKDLAFTIDLSANLFFDDFFNRKRTKSRLFATHFKDSKGLPVWVVSVVGLTAGVVAVFVRVTLDLLDLETLLQDIQMLAQQFAGSFMLYAPHGSLAISIVRHKAQFHWIVTYWHWRESFTSEC